MTTRMPIGEFSRLTQLSVKTLRYYHEVELLVPAQVDPQTGYRRYEIAQLPDALLIGRLRDLEMPLADVRRVIASPSRDKRDAVIAAHLQRMEGELDRTRGIVGSLRRLLTSAPGPLVVDHRLIPPILAVATTGRVARDDIAGWCAHTFAHLYAALAAAGVAPAGPGGASYADDFYTQDCGAVTAYVPAVAATGGTTTIPGGPFAVATHQGPYSDVDTVYAALGSHILTHDEPVPGPIREIYLVGPGDTTDKSRFRTDVCWPIAG